MTNGGALCRRCNRRKAVHAPGLYASECVFQARVKAVSASQSFSAQEVLLLNAVVSGVLVGASGRDLTAMLRGPAGSSVIRKIQSMSKSVRRQKAAVRDSTVPVANGSEVPDAPSL